MMKGSMNRSLHHEMALEWVCEKAKLAEEELFELKNWKVVTEQKLKLAEWARDEYQKMTEELKKVLEDKEIDLCHAKERAVLEYRDFDALLSELEVSYNNGFDDALHQAKALYPKLDFSSINITVAEVLWFLHRAVKRNCPSCSVKIQSMLWGSFLQSLVTRTMKTLETTQQRPWGRRAFLALPR